MNIEGHTLFNLTKNISKVYMINFEKKIVLSVSTDKLVKRMYKASNDSLLFEEEIFLPEVYTAYYRTEVQKKDKHSNIRTTVLVLKEINGKELFFDVNAFSKEEYKEFEKYLLDKCPNIIDPMAVEELDADPLSYSKNYLAMVLIIYSIYGFLAAMAYFVNKYSTVEEDKIPFTYIIIPGIIALLVSLPFIINMYKTNKLQSNLKLNMKNDSMYINNNRDKVQKMFREFQIKLKRLYKIVFGAIAVFILIGLSLILIFNWKTFTLVNILFIISIIVGIFLSLKKLLQKID